MQKALIGLVSLAIALAAASAAAAQTPLKVGLIMPYSGQFADAATQIGRCCIKLYREAA